MKEINRLAEKYRDKGTLEAVCAALYRGAESDVVYSAYGFPPSNSPLSLHPTEQIPHHPPRTAFACFNDPL